MSNCSRMSTPRPAAAAAEQEAHDQQTKRVRRGRTLGRQRRVEHAERLASAVRFQALGQLRLVVSLEQRVVLLFGGRIVAGNERCNPAPAGASSRAAVRSHRSSDGCSSSSSAAFRARRPALSMVRRRNCRRAKVDPLRPRGLRILARFRASSASAALCSRSMTASCSRTGRRRGAFR